ncbi:nucleotidyltransferase domain-containing protein [Actinocrispum sp. NPDC049592]|uniref:nucleotidyltransferase domain-containing protein n=1 Tax=Actinocrispum sp. NPDC049592 TaxID=3154835 RepID=UPI0034275E97
MTSVPAVAEFGRRLTELGWVTELYVGGSLATGDYVPGVSDLDLVALTDGPVDTSRQAALTALHQELDEGAASGLDLGCVYVETAKLADTAMKHPTWTHGRLVRRILSGISRAELVRHGYAVFGRPPESVLPPMTGDDIRAAARAELTGYWTWAARRPHLWLDPTIADLGLTSMARGRHALRHGALLTKTQAVGQAHAPAWLIDHLRARRQGRNVTSPRLRTALIAWWDAVRTTSRAR